MKRLFLDRTSPLVYVITDRRLLQSRRRGPDLAFLIEFANRAVAAGVDMVQIRERDLSAREIFYIAKTIADSSAGARTQILVNDRADIAESAGAGVHLRADSLSVDVVRAAFGREMLVGVSTHKYSELSEAEKSGADFAVFGPVFDTASKREFGKPVGLEALREVTAHLTIPVLALGGLNLSNFREALDAGAAGIAGISMFAEAQDLGSLVATIKGHGQPGR